MSHIFDFGGASQNKDANVSNTIAKTPSKEKRTLGIFTILHVASSSLRVEESCSRKRAVSA